MAIYFTVMLVQFYFGLPHLFYVNFKFSVLIYQQHQEQQKKSNVDERLVNRQTPGNRLGFTTKRDWYTLRVETEQSAMLLCLFLSSVTPQPAVCKNARIVSSTSSSIYLCKGLLHQRLWTGKTQISS